jgi:ADP-heptose:LPS heptosyltransferase
VTQGDRARRGRRILAVRLDSMGDVVLTGPAVRALAERAEVIYLSSPIGAPAAALLPGVARVERFAAPWVLADPPPVDARALRGVVSRLRRLSVDEAYLFTSSHQSPLPMALLARCAGVSRLAGVSVDHAGALLDVRIHGDPDLHEVERNLLVAGAFGARLADGDDGRLRIGRPAARSVAHPRVVIHPGAAAPARTWARDRWEALVHLLDAEGWPVIVTGSSSEAAWCEAMCAGTSHAVSAAGRTDLAALLQLLSDAMAVVCGNTGPAHLAAAVGTPVVSLYAPTVPASRWHPWGVPYRLLGRQDVGCAGCRARECPVPGHPCLAPVRPEQVRDALVELVPADSTLQEEAHA